jgi:general secretion pathway protein C
MGSAMPGTFFSLPGRSHFALGLLGLAAIAAHLQASAMMHLVAAALTMPNHSVAMALGMPKSATISPGNPKSARRILARNVFDSTTGPIDTRSKPLGRNAGDATPDLTDPLAATTCKDTAALIVTESVDATWSLATLQGQGETIPRLRRIGDDVAGKQVAYIGFNSRYQRPSVWLVSGLELCQAFLFAPAVAPPPAAASTKESVAEPRRGSARPLQAVSSRIQRVSDNGFRVDRAVVEKILSERETYLRGVRAVPDAVDGKVVGIRLLGIRQDSLPDILGLVNGDRLETVNGFSVASPETALEAYVRLRTADNLKVQIRRAGRPMTIDYEIL